MPIRLILYQGIFVFRFSPPQIRQFAVAMLRLLRYLKTKDCSGFHFDMAHVQVERLGDPGQALEGDLNPHYVQVKMELLAALRVYSSQLYRFILALMQRPGRHFFRPVLSSILSATPSGAWQTCWTRWPQRQTTRITRIPHSPTSKLYSGTTFHPRKTFSW